MRISFIDAGVLIAAVRGAPEVVARAQEVLADPEISFASSVFVRLEVLPKAAFHGREKEAAFYSGFFDSVRHWAPPSEVLANEALRIARQAGLSALDALHVAGALAVGADELITTEKLGAAIHRVRDIQVRTIQAG